MPQREAETYQLQYELGMFCRTGKNEPKTSIPEHTYHYRRLIYNIIQDTLQTAFPLTYNLIGKENWNKMVDVFFANHKCKTAQVWKVPFEFYEYYNDNIPPFANAPEFLRELLFFEWLEIEVYSMPDEEFLPFTTEGNIETDVFIPNPEIRIQPLMYPIHKKNTKTITSEDKGHYFVSIHRDYYTKRVMFNDLSYPYVEMLVKINEEFCTLNDLLPIASKYEEDKKRQTEATKEFVRFALDKNIILGFKP